MNDMQNMDRLMAEKTRQQEVYERAMAKLEHKKNLREGEGLTLMFAWDAFGTEAKENKAFATMAKGAEFFCIIFAFLTPCLLFIRYVL